MDLFDECSAPKCFTSEHHGYVFRFTRWTSNPSTMNRNRELCHEWIVSWEGSAHWGEHFTGWHCPSLYSEHEIAERFETEILPAIWPPEWQRQRVGMAA